jgi:hypothetical protein
MDRRQMAIELIKLLQKYLKKPTANNYEKITTWNPNNVQHGMVICPVFTVLNGYSINNTCDICPYFKYREDNGSLCCKRMDVFSRFSAEVLVKSIELLGIIKGLFNIP